ncbi:MAG: TonB-dependent receptor [Tannerellaceae bacterium]|jgi:TonB-linked SusC/RagA family outer membrane protein|nr:TonB-dependent receptor [Tannerellaceae bacterium]
MKIVVFFIFCFSFSVLAKQANSQNIQITLAENNVQITNVFNEIEKQTGFLFLYNEKNVDIKRNVSIHATNEQLPVILNQLFEGTDVHYAIEGKHIVLSKRKMEKEIAAVSQQSQKSIKGVVKDSQGPIIGANVIVKGTANGTITDTEGAFSLENIPPGAILQISYIGYLTKEVAIGEQEVINISLIEDTKTIDEVVVIGYGVQKKSVVTGAISSIKAEEMLTSANTRPEQALQGKTSGVQVISSSGSPGAEMKIRIRGYSSNGNSDPLYIVDGLRTDNISNLEPANIASMEVLKDGASAAIYGAEGGNGVVLITTKSGSAGKSQVSYDVQYTIQSLGKTPEVMNAQQYITYMNESGALPGITANGYDTNWIAETFEPAPMQKHNLSVSGGNDKTSYLMSLSYLDQEGIVQGKDDNYKRYSGMFNGSQQVNPWLKAGSSVQINRTIRKSMNENDESRGVISNAILLDPLTPATYQNELPDHVQTLVDAGKKLMASEDGYYYGLSQYVTGETINPLVQKRQNQTTTTTTSMMGTAYADLTPIKGLTITSKLGVNYFSRNIHNYKPEYYYSGEMLNAFASVGETDATMTYWQWENYASYIKSIGKHNLSIMVGAAVSSRKYKTVAASGYPLLKDQESYADLDYISTQANSKVGGTTLTDNKLSYFSRINYDYENKYLFQATIRRDAAGLSILPEENRWGTFPALSAGWVVSSEDFFPRNTPITSLKIRGSWGQNGSLSNLGKYSYASTIVSSGSTTNYLTWSTINASTLYPLADGSYATASSPAVLGNRNLTWETSEQFDFGADLRLFNNRLGFTIDYYRKMTKDLITTNTPPLEAGNNASPINGGNVLNKGFDFEVSWRDKMGDFSYGISANLSTLKNEVTYLDPTISRLNGANVSINTWRAATAFEKGYPVWYFHGYRTNGIDPANGDIIIADTNNDGTINANDYTYIGSAIPDLTYGGTITMEYKGVDFTMFVQGQSGNDILMGILRTDRPATNKLSLFYTERWTPENTKATRPSPTVNAGYWTSDQMIFDGSFLKIKQIQLGYVLPQRFTNKLHLGHTRIYASLDDFFTFTDYPGMDPEAATDNNNSIGIDRGFFPISKKIMFGLSLNF